MSDWESVPTTTHQDHVIAHTIGTSVMGYFVLDEAIHVLLDIGLIWTMYLDGQMVLLPQVAAINELEVDTPAKQQISREASLLEQGLLEDLHYFVPPAAECLIKDVEFYANANRRKLVLIGENSNLTIETSLETGEIHVVS
ncbi:MAG TPA: hypothetical protein VGN86_14525 [Pyrinomonadaceae bacterium]|jgi:hypothetical protein|nr:hypothetical protein [Pyrinomonadaceae bacterium]